MKKLAVLGGSNSKKSINKTLAVYAAKQVKNTELILIDLHELMLPMYGIDLETEKGIPAEVTQLNQLLIDVDGIVLSLAEHNGSYSTAFKNFFDWLSRVDGKVWKNKPMLLMATSPGARGGAGVLEGAKKSFPFFGGNIVADFSLPSFYDNFSEEGLKDVSLNALLNEKIKLLEAALG